MVSSSTLEVTKRENTFLTWDLFMHVVVVMGGKLQMHRCLCSVYDKRLLI